MVNIRKLKLSVLVLATFVSLYTFPAKAEEIIGVPVAIDGDTLEINGNRIRLFGIDAPEINQTCLSNSGKTYECGRMAASALRSLTYALDFKKLICKGNSHDKQGALIAICSVGLLIFNEQMVVDGWALADQKSGGKYLPAEAFAKGRDEGLWQGTFEKPWEWRRANPGR